MVIPFTGLLSLISWTFSAFEKAVDKEKIDSIFSEDRDTNYQDFEKILLPHFRLASHPQNYSYQTKRHMFRFLKVTSTSIPSAEVMQKVTKSTFGTTLIGSLGATAFFSGLTTEKGVFFCLDQAEKNALWVLNESTTTSLEKNAAKVLFKKVQHSRADWSQNSAPTLVLTGIKRLVGEKTIQEKREDSLTLAYQASNLRYLSSLEGLSPEEKSQGVRDYLKQEGIKSPLESHCVLTVSEIKVLLTNFF
jgi:hypothetical protein